MTKSIKTGFFIILIIIFAGFPSASAQIDEFEATPSVFSDAGSSLIITEISFKNTTADFVKALYFSPSKRSINLKGITFKDDSSFKTVESDFYVESGQTVILTFKSDSPDQSPVLNTAHTGLTGTTEQIMIMDANGKILDAACWTSSKPTTSEIADQKKLFDLGGWISPETSSCINSEAVKTNQSIIRNNLTDHNSSTDWKVSAEEIAAGEKSPGSGTSVADEPDKEPSGNGYLTTPPVTTSTSKPAPVLKAVTAKSTTSAKTAPKATKTSSAGTKKTSTTASKTKTSKTISANGELSDDLIISEILPNPDKKKDQTLEWIELFNEGENDINLGNWRLDDKDGGSKAYAMSDTQIVPAGGTLIVTSEQSKISLGNTGDEVRLFNFQGDPVDMLSYEDAPKGKSFSMIETINTEGESTMERIWTTNITPDEVNPVYYEKAGLIIADATFEDHYWFEIIDDENKTTRITFNEDLVSGPEAKITFIKGAAGTFTVNIDNELIKFVITGYPESSGRDNSALPAVIGGLIVISLAAIILLRKKFMISKPVQKS